MVIVLKAHLISHSRMSGSRGSWWFKNGGSNYPDYLPSGSKFNQGRATYSAEPQAKVTLNVCSRCARLQGDNLAERTEETSQILQSPDEIVPDSLDSLPGNEEALMEESEEFEKASKLTGPVKEYVKPEQPDKRES